MKKYIVTGTIIALIILVLYDIKIGDMRNFQAQDVLSSKIVNTPALTKSEKQLYISHSDYRPSLYEPSEGCYLGGYILANDILNYDIAEFEKKVKKPHGIYKYNLLLENGFPSNWILECISKMKTPYIVLNPSQDHMLDELKLITVAKSFGDISIPIFLDVYPDVQRYNILPDDYKKYYITIRKVFEQYAPNVSFVWSVDINNVYSSPVYYPGDEYVDWVGVSVYQPIYKDNDRYNINIWSNLDFFYNTYNRNKPVMITEFAVSHYSNVDHTYYIQDAKDKIKNFYTTIKDNYPRVKLINYMDFYGMENYKVTDDETILKTYNESTLDSYFISDVVTESVWTDKQVFKSAFEVYEGENQIYVSNRFLEYELNLVLYSDDVVEYENVKWYPIDIIKKYKNCEIQINNDKIYIEVLQ